MRVNGAMEDEEEQRQMNTKKKKEKEYKKELKSILNALEKAERIKAERGRVVEQARVPRV